MAGLLRLSDYRKEDILHIFEIADEIQNGGYRDFLMRKTVVMFFPDTSIRTRVSFEKGVYLMGGQTVLFPPESLDKREEIQDVAGYLGNWADLVIVRHKEIGLMESMYRYSKVPVINAMTDINHPCEIIADMYALSKLRESFLTDKYLFCGGRGNIGLAWKEAADVMGLSLSQCCPKGFEIEGLPFSEDLNASVRGKDIICTDSLPAESKEDFRNFQITEEAMRLANEGALLNPCPPFYRGEEVSKEVLDTEFFVGYEFKKHLLFIQQAIMVYCMTH